MIFSGERELGSFSRRNPIQESYMRATVENDTNEQSKEYPYPKSARLPAGPLPAKVSDGVDCVSYGEEAMTTIRRYISGDNGATEMRAVRQMFRDAKKDMKALRERSP